MKRRNFLKALGTILVAPTVLVKAAINNPVAYTAEAAMTANKLWARTMFDFALQDMDFTAQLSKGPTSIIKIEE